MRQFGCIVCAAPPAAPGAPCRCCKPAGHCAAHELPLQVITTECSPYFSWQTLGERRLLRWAAACTPPSAVDQTFASPLSRRGPRRHGCTSHELPPGLPASYCHITD